MKIKQHAALALFLLTSATAMAESALERIRKEDLNDYALGLAFSIAQSPYLGAANTTLIYPVLTSVEHSSFTRSRLLIRGENIGVRFVTDNDWEFGWVGRVQTLGTGAGQNPALRGIQDRSWAIETGPLIGWRALPVHLQLRSYWELPDRHNGNATELEFSYPVNLDHGYVVPAVRLSYLSAGYSNYYFGVSAQEATGSLPEYVPGSSTNIWAGVSFGYELTPEWLLRGAIGVERFDGTVNDSPLVADDRIWTASIAFAHRANFFVPRDTAGSSRDREFEIRVSALNGGLDTKVSRDAAGGQPGDTVELENFLGAADRKTIAQFDGTVRVGYYHRLELSAFRLTRQAATVIAQDLTFGDRTYPAGTSLQTEIDSDLLRAAYAYSLLRDGQKEFGFSAGLSYFRFKTSLNETGLTDVQRLSARAPLPTIGAFGTASLRGKWRISADAEIFALNFDHYHGFMSYLSLGLERKLGDVISIGAGYDFYVLSLSVDKQDVAGKFDLRYQGPKLFFSLTF